MTVVSDKTMPRGEGTARRVTFDNGYTASVVRHEGSYGWDQGLFELAVMVDGVLVYDTPITNDVIGWLKEEELPALLAQIEALPPRNNKSVVGTLTRKEALTVLDQLLTPPPLAEEAQHGAA